MKLNSTMSKLWQNKESGKLKPAIKKMEAFTVGNDYILDQVLVPYDLAASKVHAEALHDAGVLSRNELDKLIRALNKIREIWKKGEFEIRIEDEDMHTAIELYLTEKLGDLGKKIHTGRSRNDQVLTAMRLYEKEKLEGIVNELKKTAGLLLDFAEQNQNIPMPGFTHTRKAMLSSVAQWAGGYAELMIMQADASTGVQSLINRSPLGTAAGFGTTFPINREAESQKLGFASPIACAATAQLSRGWVELQLVQYLYGITAILNRFASDIILYTGEAYRFFELDAAICTGSSIMPQKKNPDLAELLRARHSLVAGYSGTLQMVTANLTGGYHRDLQLTKEPVIKSFENTFEMLEAAQLLIENMQANQNTLEEACTSELFAAEAANKLVKDEGISFREAYHQLKENPELVSEISIGDLMNGFTQLGSPGNPGIAELKAQLNASSDG